MRWMLVLSCIWLAGCPLRPLPLPTEQVPPPAPPPPAVEILLPADGEPPPEVLAWLAVLEQSLLMEPAQARALMVPLEPGTEPLLVFHQALLHQQQDDRRGWIGARDLLRELLEQEHPPGVRPLLQMLLTHNQALINALQQRTNLGEQLKSTRAERDALEEKIRALTNLERRLDDRKERGAEAANGPLKNE
ncbi:hypothetical protein [Motiliproteus sp. SC1-56]|uniref:hypothetical protein n=1 Tax=Motiliproteus sp. SC1-56 TaxID=2799565 RepID=UPI001A90C587|nr:hypothetical protein [Motiliproteus sp. SC1-56]